MDNILKSLKKREHTFLAFGAEANANLLIDPYI